MGRKIQQTSTETKKRKGAALRRSDAMMAVAPSKKHDGVTNPTLAKLARRGGMERVPKVAKEYLKLQSEYHLYLLIRAAIIVVSSNNRSKITVDDVVLASRLALGKEMVGFRNKRKKRQRRKRVPQYESDQE